MAARRLHGELRRIGIDSTFFNLERAIPEERIELVPSAPTSLPARLASRWRAARIERERAEIRRRLDRAFDGFSDDRTSLVPDVAARLAGHDVVHIHGTTYLVDFPRTLRALAARGQGVVWTLHDMNPFTGGCHYDRECGRYLEECGCCPALRSNDARDFSHTIWRRKSDGLDRLDPARTIVTCPSEWLAGEARRSPLLSRFEAQAIPNGLDLDFFRPVDRAMARERFGFPARARIVLFVASSLEVERKGFPQLAQAMRRLEGLSGLLLAGAGASGESPAGIPCRLLGPVSDPTAMRDLYSAADVLAVPSLQDNLPNTVMEAMACGLPVAAFAAGGIPEMVRPGRTGLLAPVGDAAALAEAIGTLLGDEDARRRMGEEARRVAEREYGEVLQADRYSKIYKTLLSNRLVVVPG